jgi:uncharacterized membrane protein YjfL (UPF0719 family)
MEYLNVKYLVGSVAYALLGMVIFGVGFWVFDRLTPGRLWDEIIHKQNMALAIIVGCVSLGICLIIASAIHG